MSIDSKPGGAILHKSKFETMKDKYLSRFSKLFPHGSKKHRTAMVACEVAAFSVSPEDVAAYMNTRMNRTDYPMHEVAEIMGRFQIADDLHGLYFGDEAAEMRKGACLIGDVTPSELAEGRALLRPADSRPKASTKEFLENAMAKRFAQMNPDADVEEGAREFIEDWDTMEKTVPEQTRMDFPPPNTPAPPPPVLVPVTPATAAAATQEAAELADATTTAASTLDAVSATTTQATFDRTLNTLFQGDAGAKMSQEEKEIAKALMKTSAGVLRDSLLKLVEEKTLKELNAQKIRLLEAENAKMKSALQTAVVSNVDTVASLEVATQKAEEKVSQLQTQPAVSAATLAEKEREVDQMKVVLDNKKQELTALSNQVQNITPVMHFKTVSPLEVIDPAQPAVEDNPLDFTKVRPEPVPSLGETAKNARTSQIKDFGSSASRIIKSSGKSAGSLFSKIMGSTAEGGAKLLPALADAAGKIVPVATEAVGKTASGFTENAPAVTDASISVVSSIQKKKRASDRRKKRAAKKDKSHPKKKKSTHRKKGKRGIGALIGYEDSDDEEEVDEIGDPVNDDGDEDDLIGEPMGDESTTEDGDEEDDDLIGEPLPVVPNQIGIKKIGDPVMEDEYPIPLNPDTEALLIVSEPKVSVDPRGILHILWNHPLLPDDLPEFQFPEHLSASSVLSLLPTTNMKIVILQRIYLFCHYYPRANRGEAKDFVALRERIDEALAIPSQNTEISYDPSRLTENQAASVEWIKYMTGKNFSEFPEKRRVFDFLLYLVLVITRSDRGCMAMYHFIFDYSLAIPYSRASEMSYNTKGNTALMTSMAKFKE